MSRGARRPSMRGAVTAPAGCAVVAGSMLFPWYAADGLSRTAIDTFGLVEAGLLLTIAAAAWLCLRPAGEALPRPLGEGALLVAAGAWCGVLLGYRLLVRPEFGVSDPGDTGIRYGLLLAYAGAALMVAGGLRRRRESSPPRP